MPLTTEQFSTIQHHFKNQGWSKLSSYEECLDHFCCNVEQGLSEGRSFERAFAQALTHWQGEEVQKMNSFHQKSSIMIKVVSLLSVLLAVLTFSPLQPVDDSAVLSVENKVIRLEPPVDHPLKEEFRETAGFGDSWHPIQRRQRFHRGIDWGAPTGTPVHAAGNGVVIEAEEHDKYGLRIIVAHDEIYQTLYAHLSEIRVEVGETITAGQWIGDVGSTGVSTGPHLHYEVIKNGQAVDPKQFLP